VQTHAATFRVPARADAFEAALEGLTRVNEGLMQRETLPPLYEAGVRYRDEPRDVWKHAVDVGHDKFGDCEDLAAYRAAELRVSGEDPGAYVTTYKSGPNRYHAVVARSGGLVEDPSRVLGMGQKKMKPIERGRSVNVLGDDPLPGENAITFEVIKLPGGWGKRAGYRGYLRFPLGMTPGAAAAQALMTIGPVKPTPEAATQATAQTAVKALLNNPAIQATAQNAAKSLLDNPAIQAAIAKLPPGAAQGAQLLTNPTLVALLKSDNPALRAAALINPMALARPDIYAQNAKETAQDAVKLFKKLF
jgi:hypothetical protein